MNRLDRTSIDVVTAFEIFAASFTLPPFRRQVTTRRAVGPLWRQRYDYEWQGARRTGDSFFIRVVAPQEALALVRESQPLPQHELIVLDDQPDVLAAYTAAGYKLTFTEYLMARPLVALPPCDPRYEVQRITTAEQAAWANARDPESQPWVFDLHLADPSMAHYAIVRDDQVVTRTRVVRYDASCSYVSHVATHPDYRRQGLGRAVMLRLLHDCAARGETESVLVASEEGDLLYRSLGYTRLGTLLVFTPDV